MEAHPSVDIDLRKEHVQDLSGREAVEAFFASLGYDTSARTPQTPANLGIGAHSQPQLRSPWSRQGIIDWLNG